MRKKKKTKVTREVHQIILPIMVSYLERDSLQKLKLIAEKSRKIINSFDMNRSKGEVGALISAVSPSHRPWQHSQHSIWCSFRGNTTGTSQS